MKTVMKEDGQVAFLERIVEALLLTHISHGGKDTLGSAGHLPLSSCGSTQVSGILRL